MVGAAAALIGPVAYLDIAYGLHGGDKPLTDYMFQVLCAWFCVVWIMGGVRDFGVPPPTHTHT